jgi:hypothetical protein
VSAATGCWWGSRRPSSCWRSGLTVGSPAGAADGSGLRTGRAARWRDATPAASSTLEYNGTPVVMPVRSSTRSTGGPGAASTRPALACWGSLAVSHPSAPSIRPPSAGGGSVTSAIRHPSMGSKKLRNPCCTSAPSGRCAGTGVRSTASMLLAAGQRTISPDRTPCRLLPRQAPVPGEWPPVPGEWPPGPGSAS